jgi:hypothetical protein
MLDERAHGKKGVGVWDGTKVVDFLRWWLTMPPYLAISFAFPTPYCGASTKRFMKLKQL